MVDPRGEGGEVHVKRHEMQIIWFVVLLVGSSLGTMLHDMDQDLFQKPSQCFTVEGFTSFAS